MGKARRKSITALKSENINVSLPGRQGCGTLGAVMALFALLENWTQVMYFNLSIYAQVMKIQTL